MRVEERPAAGVTLRVFLAPPDPKRSPVLIRRGSALTPIFNLTAVTTPGCFLTAYLFAADARPVFAAVLVGCGLIPPALACWAYFHFRRTDPICIRAQETIVRASCRPGS